MTAERNNISGIARQSAPVDTTKPYDPTLVAGKTIVITGGASGFGEGFFKKWAQCGATVIIGDINDVRGRDLVDEVRKTTGNPNHHYLHCDVTNWQSQVDFFRDAVKLSPTGGIDTVVANAGIPDEIPFELPLNLDVPEPPKPNYKCLQVNMIGVMYTAQLALFHLPRNTHSKAANPSTTPTLNTPDRHLLLLGSIASVCPIPGQIQYSVAKHGVLGMFRSLRATSFMRGIRVNMLCPYFINTPIIPAGGRLLLAGSAMGEPEDVVDAGTRLVADTSIVGRALAVGPKVRVDDDWNLVSKDSEEGNELAVWEVYAHDFEEVDVFTARFVRLLNTVEIARGWLGWASDIVGAFTYPLKAWVR